VGIIVIPRLLFAVTTRNLSKAAALEEQVRVQSSLHGLHGLSGCQVHGLSYCPVHGLSCAKCMHGLSCCPVHDLSCRQGMACGLQSAAPNAACTVNEEHSMGWVGVYCRLVWGKGVHHWCRVVEGSWPLCTRKRVPRDP
jgi:hypothetical protein